MCLIQEKEKDICYWIFGNESRQMFLICVTEPKQRNKGRYITVTCIEVNGRCQ